MLKKLMLLAAMLAMVLAAAAPAFAQDIENQEQEQEQEATSGDVTVEGDSSAVSGEDINIAQCEAVLNQVNTGNQNTQQAIQQYGFYYAYQYADQDAAQY